jgi:hypothetical protein
MENSAGFGGPTDTFASLASAAFGYNANKIVVHVKKDDSTVLEFGAGDPLGWQTHSVTIEGHRSFQIAYAQRDDLDSWLHILTSPPTSQRLRRRSCLRGSLAIGETSSKRSLRADLWAHKAQFWGLSLLLVPRLFSCPYDPFFCLNPKVCQTTSAPF